MGGTTSASMNTRMPSTSTGGKGMQTGPMPGSTGGYGPPPRYTAQYAPMNIPQMRFAQPAAHYPTVAMQMAGMNPFGGLGGPPGMMPFRPSIPSFYGPQMSSRQPMPLPARPPMQQPIMQQPGAGPGGKGMRSMPPSAPSTPSAPTQYIGGPRPGQMAQLGPERDMIPRQPDGMAESAKMTDHMMRPAVMPQAAQQSMVYDHQARYTPVPERVPPPPGYHYELGGSGPILTPDSTVFPASAGPVAAQQVEATPSGPSLAQLLMSGLS
jgi:hypothetical protein